MKPIRILLADDHVLVRGGIRALLQQIPDIEIVAEAENGNEAVRLVAETQPDIALIDIAMPELDGLTATLQIKKEFPDVKVIILSMHSDEEYVMRALSAGAKGYLLKGARVSELEIAVTAVVNGDTYLSPTAARYLVADAARRASGERSPLEKLTPRQRQVLRLIAAGRTRKQIANELQVSAKTVDSFRAQLMEQLGIRDVAGLVRFAINAGLVPPSQPRPAEKDD